MDAIRISKKSKAGGTEHFMVHVVVAGRTLCGRRVEDLDVIAEMEIEKLPALEGCRGCDRVDTGWIKPGHTLTDRGVTLPSAPGRSRSAGPLNHGTRIRRGTSMR